MARDIEEFLRKAAERRQQQKGGAPKKTPAPTPQPPVRRPAPRRQEPLIIADSEIVKARSVPPQRPKPKPPNIRNESVADHVKSHINTSDIASHADSLGDRIAEVHDQVDARIHQRLDRDLTEIDDTPSVTDAPRRPIIGARDVSAAAQLQALLQDPQSVGQAILIAEILKRPDV